MSYHKADSEHEGEVTEEEETLRLYAKPLRAPILGKHFQLPGRSAAEQRIELDVTASYIPVFTHLKIHEAIDLVRPNTPPAIRRVTNESYMDFYEPAQNQVDMVKGDSIREDIMKPSGRPIAKGNVLFSQYDGQDKDAATDQ